MAVPALPIRVTLFPGDPAELGNGATARISAALGTYVCGLMEDLRIGAAADVGVQIEARALSNGVPFRIRIGDQQARVPFAALERNRTESDPQSAWIRAVAVAIYNNRALLAVADPSTWLGFGGAAGQRFPAAAPTEWPRQCAALVAANGFALERLRVCTDQTGSWREGVPTPEQALEAVAAEPSAVRVGLSLGAGFDAEALRAQMESLRAEVFSELGLLCPKVEIRRSDDLHTGAWQLRVNDCRLPVLAGDAVSCRNYVQSEVRTHAAALFSRGMFVQQLEILRADRETLMAIVQSRHGIDRIGSVVRALLSEQVSVRDLPMVLDALLSICLTSGRDTSHLILFAPNFGVPCITERGTLASLGLRDYVECARMRLTRWISNRYSTEGQMMALLVGPDTEKRIPGIDPSSAEAEDFAGRVWEEYREQKDKSPVILTTVECRSAMRNLIREEIPDLHVLSYQELSPDLSITPLARVT